MVFVTVLSFLHLKVNFLVLLTNNRPSRKVLKEIKTLAYFGKATVLDTVSVFHSKKLNFIHLKVNFSALLTNIRSSWKVLKEINTLAYFG